MEKFEATSTNLFHLISSKVHGNFFRDRENCLKERCRFFRLATFSREEERERKNSIDPADWSRKREGIVDERWLPREADVLSRRQLHHHLPGSWLDRPAAFACLGLPTKPNQTQTSRNLERVSALVNLAPLQKHSTKLIHLLYLLDAL